MAAIAEELVFREAPRATDDDAPEVSVAFGPAGRETLALIESTAPPPRARQSTIGYGDRISNAPGAKTPSQPAAKTPSHAPVAKLSSRAPAAKTPSHVPAAKAASRAPAPKTASHAPTAKPSTRAPAAAKAPKVPDAAAAVLPTIFEMLTFVVQGADVASLASEEQRRRFVETHLRKRLPNQDMGQVDRVDVTPWTVKDTVVVRVWCKI